MQAGILYLQLTCKLVINLFSVEQKYLRTQTCKIISLLFPPLTYPYTGTHLYSTVLNKNSCRLN